MVAQVGDIAGTDPEELVDHYKDLTFILIDIEQKSTDEKRPGHFHLWGGEVVLQIMGVKGR